jgi:hypothetical protein
MANNKEKLLALQSKLKQKTSNKEIFEGLVVVNIGIEPTAYFPKVKNADGTNAKDEDGNDKRSKTQTGQTYTFVEYGTGRTVKVVLSGRLQLTVRHVPTISGKGYNIKQSRMLFIDEGCKVERY